MRFLDVEPISDLSPELSLIGAMLQDGTRKWREELGDVTEEQIVWQPGPNLHSIGAILLHIAEVEGYWIQEVILNRPFTLFELEQAGLEIIQYDVNWPKPPSQPLNWYIEMLDRVRAETLRALASMGDPVRRITLPNRKYEVTVRWILQHVLNHEAYHAGQAVLLKLLNESVQGLRSSNLST